LTTSFDNIKNSDHGKTAKSVGVDIKPGNTDKVCDHDDGASGNSGSGAVINGIALLNITSKHIYFSYDLLLKSGGKQPPFSIS
jgi:hypothetical protein